MAAIGQTEDHGSRWYVDPADPSRRFESVTTVLSMAASSSWKAAWGAKVAAEWIGRNVALYADIVAAVGPVKAAWLCRAIFTQERDLKADIGSHQHHVLEALLLDRPLPDVPEHLVGVEVDGERVDHDAISDGLVNFLTDHGAQMLMAEATVANPIHGIAGTLDAYADLTGRPAALIDCKSGRQVHDDVPLQLAAYARATEVWIDIHGNKAPMPPAEHALVLHLRREHRGGYKLLDLPDAMLDETWRSFLALHRSIRVREGIPALRSTVVPAPGASPYVEDVPELARCWRALDAAGLTTVADLAQFSPSDLAALRGIGPKALAAIVAAIEAHHDTTREQEVA